ncbi:MAG: DUF1232 domain-containing protein [Deltaproteobacteria bacterium]|nr:DUF1232 domain-containing protein [Deltaproteobacteria bacterium]MBW2417109.1 DUF1232 domain-containing protein [Deltaproteobacteria bacterium]
MTGKPFKVTFTLDEEDASYFRRRFRAAKRAAKDVPAEEILTAAKGLVTDVRKSKKTPKFVIEAVDAIDDLTRIIEDEDYRAPKSVSGSVLAALAYFVNPEDLIPDDIPVLGFLDDAVMIKFVEEEFKHELWAYRKFRKFRDGAEQRPWTNVASDRLPGRLKATREKLRSEVKKRKERDEQKGRIAL